jgi:replication-associated recombination protein RarA
MVGSHSALVAGHAAPRHNGQAQVRHALAQATAYLVSAPKCNRAGLAYWAAMADVLGSGSLPVPLHLRNAPIGRMRAHGIGIGYRYPHDYEGADVAQQYLPDALAERRYYVPSAEGLEARIGERLDRLRAERSAKGSDPGRAATAGLPKADPMRTAGGVMKTRQGKLAQIADAQKGDAG